MKISVTKGLTIGVGKFESIRIEATTEFETTAKPLSVAAEKDMQDAFDFVDKQLNKQVGDIQGSIKPDSVFVQEKSVRAVGLPSEKPRNRRI